MKKKCSHIFILILFTAFKMNAQKVELFPLSDVRLLGGPLKNAQDVDLKYILDLNVDRLLAPFCEDAGIEPKAPKYGNWESKGLGGQTGGHYLTALSLMYQSTGNPELLRRLNYMVSVLAECQLKNGNGYVSGIPNSKKLWNELAVGDFKVVRGANLNGSWVPWYNLHKTLAGLRDAYLIGGNKQAMDVLIKLADWCNAEVSGLSEEKMQQMLGTEHGGMNEVLADVYFITRDKKYLILAQKFSHKAILDPLLKGEDKLTGIHANTQIPKVIGFERISKFSGDTTWHNAAKFFWETIVNKRSLAFGGNSVNEFFNPPTNFSSVIESASGPETCNTYNMLRLSKMLYTESCSLKYIDFYERGLFNHILSSQHPDHGGFVYLTSIHPQHYRTYSSVQDCFWCCVGTGIENHGKYGELIYSHTDNDLFINLFVSSKLTWKEKGLILTQETKFPESEISYIKLQLKKTSKFTLNVRYPAWVKSGISVKINGKDEKIITSPSKYIAINREWKDGDLIALKIPMELSTESLPDHSPWIAFMYGPIVLAAKTDTMNMDNLIAEKPGYTQYASGKLYSITDAPLIVCNPNEIISKIKQEKDKVLTFTLSDIIYPDKFKNLKLIPFYKLHDSRYMMYWETTLPQDLEKTIKTNIQKYMFTDITNSKTVDQVSPGEQQSEIDHNLESENSNTGIFNEKKWRDAYGWFSYDFKDPKNIAASFQVTYCGKDFNREFDIVLNDNVLITQKLDANKGETFYTVNYTIPDNYKTKASSGYTLKFIAKPNSVAGGVYNIVLLKK